MTTISSLVDRVRLELGDQGKSFVTQFMADGTTNRFRLNYSPLDATSVYVYQNSVDITSTSYVEESTGILVTPTVPADGVELSVNGIYYRYFTAAELTTLVTQALAQHTANHTDSLGRQITVENLPVIEEYPVVIYATTLALYTLATDASFDIDIAAPDGVSIPRSERYRQLMDMVNARQEQYRTLCVLLGIGLYKVEVFTLRRISKATGRYVPVYLPQEVDDRSYPQRVYDQLPTYGNKPMTWITDGGELTAYQGRSFSTTVNFTGDYWGDSFVSYLLNQRGSVLQVQQFALSVVDNNGRNITAATRTVGSNTATFTSAGHGFTAGTSVVVLGVNTELNATWTIASVTTDTFSVTTTATTAIALTGLTAAVSTAGTRPYTATISLTSDQTLRLAERTYWSIQLGTDVSPLDANTGTTLPVEIKGGNFFTERVSSVVL